MATLTKAQLTKLAAERKAITSQIDELTKRKATIDEKLLSADLDQTYVGNGVALSYTPVHGLDTALIAKRFPASKRPEFYKLTLDTPAFRKHFSQVELEAFEKVTHRIKIETVED